jgi:hypothetical protein
MNYRKRTKENKNTMKSLQPFSLPTFKSYIMNKIEVNVCGYYCMVIHFVKEPTCRFWSQLMYQLSLLRFNGFPQIAGECEDNIFKWS